MLKLKKKIPVHPLVLVALAFSASLAAMSFASSDEIELTGPTVEEIKTYLQAKHDKEDSNPFFDSSAEDFRIRNFDPGSAQGKIVIKVHKSKRPPKLEYMEVFRQRSADPADLEPIQVFDSGTTHQVLVSTAGTYGSKTYVTPSGTFGFDSLEKMHYSSKYNNAPMPWTMFFNGGIAIHGATPSEYKQLGRKASHGCVRVHPTFAKELFELVRTEGRAGAIVQIFEE